MPVSADPYTYPGTDILRNIPDIRDPERLAGFEANATVARLAELDANPMTGHFDVARLRAIHRYIFQDVYAWAGQFRTVNISKGGHLFADAAFIEPALLDLLGKLRDENYLMAAGSNAFAERAAFYLAEVNAIHPCREENGRTQREFIRQLGRRSGHAIDWRHVTRPEMLAASRESFATGDSSGFANVMRACMT